MIIELEESETKLEISLLLEGAKVEVGESEDKIESVVDNWREIISLGEVSIFVELFKVVSSVEIEIIEEPVSVKKEVEGVD